MLFRFYFYFNFNLVTRRPSGVVVVDNLVSCILDKKNKIFLLNSYFSYLGSVAESVRT